MSKSYLSFVLTCKNLWCGKEYTFLHKYSICVILFLYSLLGAMENSKITWMYASTAHARWYWQQHMLRRTTSCLTPDVSSQVYLLAITLCVHHPFPSLNIFHFSCPYISCMNSDVLRSNCHSTHRLPLRRSISFILQQINESFTSLPSCFIFPILKSILTSNYVSTPTPTKTL